MSFKFNNIVVIGAGLLGHGIALTHALGGSKVTLCDLSDDILTKAKELVGEAALTLVKSGQITADEAEEVMARIACSSDVKSALNKADYVVEAVSENERIKKIVFEQIADNTSDDCVITSNTSYLDIFSLIPETIKNRTLIVHWYTPPYVIDLVDVVPAEGVPNELTDAVIGYLTNDLGKKPVRLKKFVPGYLANRIQMAIESEIFSLLDDGVADAEDIDNAIRDGLALRLAMMGQLKKIDFTGLKIVKDSHNLGIYVPPTPPTVSTVLEKMVEEGREGVASGSGFYDYSGKEAKELYRERDLKLIELKEAIKKKLE